MATLFVLQVPEFAPLCEAMERKEGIDAKRRGHYLCLSAANELHVSRKDTGLGLAVWYGSLTGGFSGTIAQFDNDELRIIDE